jgi:hypothetical protein
MRLFLLAVVGGFLAREALERVADWRWERAFRRMVRAQDEMDVVQPSDPWPPAVRFNVVSMAGPDVLDDWLDAVRVHSRFSGGTH